MRSLLAVLACTAGFSGQAFAQNLVSNPNFADGLSGYSGYGDTATTYAGQTAALITGFANYVEQDGIPTVNGTTYVFSFLAAAQDASSPVTLAALFDGGNEIAPTISSTAFTRYTLTGVATSAYGQILLQDLSSGSGGVYVTGLDLEPEGAPAPVPGGGAASAAVLLSGLALYRLRGRMRGQATV